VNAVPTTHVLCGIRLVFLATLASLSCSVSPSTVDSSALILRIMPLWKLGENSGKTSS
jgi:hypothetical protein